MKESVYEQKKLFNCYCSLILPKLNSERKAESKQFFYIMKTFFRKNREAWLFKNCKTGRVPIKTPAVIIQTNDLRKKRCIVGYSQFNPKAGGFPLFDIIGNDKIQAESGLRVHWKYLLLLKSIFIIHSAW